MNRIFLFVVAALLTALSTQAQNFQYGDLYYTITSDSTVEITFRSSSYSSPTMIIPDTVTYNGTTYCVTSIGEYAFYSCNLTSITIPHSVTNIGEGAFYACGSLTTIVVDEDNPTYDSRNNCNAIIHTETNTLIRGVSNTVVPNNVTSIGEEAFSDCVALDSITLPNSITSIGNYAFLNCSGLTYVTLPDSLTAIQEGAFCSCTNLPSITIPGGVTSIGDRAFYFCFALTSINIPHGVTSIGTAAFLNCSALTSINIPNSVTSIGDRAFKQCSNLTQLGISNSLISIGNNAFESCSALSSLQLPNSITSIGSEAFKDCSNIPSLILPDSLTSIGSGSFSGCSGLTTITIPHSVTSIGSYAFSNCTQLMTIICKATTPPACDSNAKIFSKVPTTCTIRVPCSSISVYNIAPWNQFYLTSLPSPTLQIQSSNELFGTAMIDQFSECDSMAIISATPNFGYHFVKWSDNSVTNPRIVKLTQDTLITAEFAQTFSGQCGDDLYWNYENNELNITGLGDMYDFSNATIPWLLFRDSIHVVRIADSATYIGEYAFANCQNLGKLFIGEGVERIAEKAFGYCRNLHIIYCNPTNPPLAENKAFTIFNAYLYVPCSSKTDYSSDAVWGNFYIVCLDSADTNLTDNNVTVVADSVSATFIWPATDGADTYSIIIKKYGKVFRTLIFDSQGVLTSIAYAPAKDSSQHPSAAQLTVDGYQFIVRELNRGTHYEYTLDAQDGGGNIVAHYAGSFATLSETSVETIPSESNVRKFFRDGHIIILKDGEKYTILGQKL